MHATTYQITPQQGQENPEQLDKAEWLLTNGLGGFAMGTPAGVPTRRYHGLLIASLRPPVNRIMALASIAETVILAPGTRAQAHHDLSCFRFAPDTLHPRGDRLITRFWNDTGVHWAFQAGGVKVTKSVHLVRHQPTVIISYQIETPAPARLLLRPLVGMRDFHALQLRELSRDRFRVQTDALTPGQVDVHAEGTGTLRMHARNAWFSHDENWWHNFLYRIEQERGYDALEDLYTPGTFTADLTPGQQTVQLRASLGVQPDADLQQQADAQRSRLTRMMDATRVTLGPAFSRIGPQGKGPVLDRIAALVDASDDFVVRRVRPGAMPGAPGDRESIIAGYPWFADWGRDSMIALPGLLLTTGRLTEACQVLRTFAGACKDGLIPNVFDDYSGQAHYNTVDASLWFIQAACGYFKASGDDDTFERELLPACREIVEKYRDGTHFGIGMDPADGLVHAGDASTQLTWMDAKRDGVVFTPRHGKPVEINALWHSGLAELSLVCGALARPFAEVCKGLAQRAGTSLREKFWNAQRSCLYDVLTPGGPDASIRPNMIFAVSLSHSPLTRQQQQQVVRVAIEKLYTPRGVRTLAPGEPGYRGRFRGRMFERDAAYHNGTAWPWLLGPLAEALCRSEQFTPAALMQAQAMLDPIVQSLQDGCLGQLAEVYDGDHTPDDPQAPGGCPAQAWSVAEALRALVLVTRVQAGSGEE